MAGQTEFRHTFGWHGTSSDPNDEQFGHVVSRTTPDDLDGFDAVFVGEPYDGAVIGRRGARKGPDAIREALAGTKSHHFDAGPVSRVGDLGDVARLLDLLPSDRTVTVDATQRRVEEATRKVHAADVLPVFLGGDNSMTVSNVRPLLDSDAEADSESVGVVSLDAHLDCREVRGDPTSGTPYRQLHDAGLDAFAVLGARHFETSSTYHDFVRERDGEIVTSDEVGEDPVAAADRALSALSDVDRVYVSLDVDVLDATAAPGVSAPTPGGLTTREVFQVLRLLASDDRLAGFEVVECAPPLDDGDRTATAAARAVAHVLAAAGVGSGEPPAGALGAATSGTGGAP